MRHADIRTTTNGDIVTDEVSLAASKISGLALNGRRNGRWPVHLLEKMVSAGGLESTG